MDIIQCEKDFAGIFNFFSLSKMKMKVFFTLNVIQIGRGGGGHKNNILEGKQIFNFKYIYKSDLRRSFYQFLDEVYYLYIYIYI